jgi:sterol desaturase/sphingolipid hydroxylase (fatty acid hydroxylase superfamily)
LDLWRHSGFTIPEKAENLIGRIFITPKDHGWHHSSTTHGKNFGANFSIWDKWHSTYYQSSTDCDLLGEKINDPFAIQWLQPWKIKSGGFDS